MRPACVPSDSLITTVLAIVTATGIFVLILMTFFLIVCMWTQKKVHFHVMEGRYESPVLPVQPAQEALLVAAAEPFESLINLMNVPS